jgi:hypothetical protein
MHTPALLQHSFRAGTFSNLQSADRAVERLLAAGFPKEQITVLCTNEVKESHFRQLGYESPADLDAPSGGLAGASVGAAVGGLVAIAVGAATGAVPLIIAGAAGVSGGSAMGGFLGAIMNGEGDNEIVEFYGQQLRSGKILVVAEDESPQAESKLSQAAAILANEIDVS